MKEDEIRKAQGKRLATVRAAAGYLSARSAAMECGWPESTYRAHENGSRTIGQDDARRYVNRFTIDGAKGFTAQWIQYGTGESPEQSLDDLIRNQPAEIREKAYRAVRSVLKK